MTVENIYLVYGRTNPPCPYCENMKTLLDSRNIDYEYKDIGDEGNFEEFCSFRLKTVPAVFKGGKYLGGFTEVKELV